jgi:hypothetical protein
MRLAIVLFISCLTGLNLSRCKSYDITQKIKDQRTENEEAKEIVEAYIPIGANREKVVRALENSSKLLSETDKARQAEKADKEKETIRADKNAGAAKTIFWAKVASGLALAGLGFYGLKKFSEKIPIVGRFL